jgi:hypothetical protein
MLLICQCFGLFPRIIQTEFRSDDSGDAIIMLLLHLSCLLVLLCKQNKKYDHTAQCSVCND